MYCRVRAQCNTDDVLSVVGLHHCIHDVVLDLLYCLRCIAQCVATHAVVPGCPRRAAGIDPQSPLGLFIRRCRVAFNTLPFEVS